MNFLWTRTRAPGDCIEFLNGFFFFFQGTSSVIKQSDNNLDIDAKLKGNKKGLKAILGGLEELWDQSQYTEEYNLSQFLSKLSG